MLWYKQLEQWLLPTKGAVTIALIIVVLITVVLLLGKSNSARTLWAAYLISP